MNNPLFTRFFTIKLHFKQTVKIVLVWFDWFPAALEFSRLPHLQPDVCDILGGSYVNLQLTLLVLIIWVWVLCLDPDGGVMSKDSLPNQSTTLEALLRGEGLDKRNNSKEEESLLEIQVRQEEGAALQRFSL